MKAVAIRILCAGLMAQQASFASPIINPAAKEHIRRLIESLPAQCDLRGLLEAGQQGDGIHHPWMDDMRREGVKEAWYVVQFVWDHGPKELNVQSATYFSDYCRRQLLQDVQITNPDRLRRIAASTLQRELEQAVLAKAKRRLREILGRAHWNAAHGTVFVVLTDDEWIPPLEDDESDKITDADFTPLMDAAIAGEDWLVAKLLRTGANVNARNGKGWTALMYAADHDRARIVGALLRAGANPKVRNIEGETALSIATRQHYTDIVQSLRQAEADE